MPERILDKHPDECFTIPMPSGKVRSLNLSTAAGIVLYEALQQLGQTEAAAVAGGLAKGASSEKPAPKRRGRPRRGPA